MAEISLNPMTKMSQIPQNQKPVTHEVPLNQMSQMSQVTPYQMSQMPQNEIPLISQVPQNERPPMAEVAFGPKPCTVTCPSCGVSIVTAISMKATRKTHLTALLLFCCCTILTCVPYCMDSCQNTDHYCPNCDAYLGTYKS